MNSTVAIVTVALVCVYQEWARRTAQEGMQKKIAALQAAQKADNKMLLDAITKWTELMHQHYEEPVVMRLVKILENNMVQ